MKSERKKAIVSLILINLSVIAFTIAFILVFKPWSVLENGPSYTCVFQKALGFYCPGCGGTRAVGSFFKLDFLHALYYYPPIFIGIFLILYIDFILARSLVTNDFSYISKHKYFEFLLIPISILLTFLIRNACLIFGVDLLGDFTSAFYFLSRL